MKKLRKYLVSAEASISIHTIVEARSKKEAKRIAKNQPMCSIHTHRADLETTNWMPSDDLDGIPQKMVAVEI